MKALALLLAVALGAHAAAPIRFHTARPGYVSLNIYRPDGSLARQILAGAPFSAGDHTVQCDLPPGGYTWRALFHGDLALKLRGWIGDFGGDRGPPSAAASDDMQVYLGWSLATADADAIVACDPEGNPRWTQHRGPLSGCRALSVDAGTLYVLGGQGADAEGRAIFRLKTRDGSPVPWPDGRIDLKIASLWPATGKYKPDRADYFAVKNGRIFLSFTAGQFIAVLDAKTGKYLQTIVGAPPGPIDSVATKSDNPDDPGQLMNADFVVVALSGGSIGKILLAQDPIWVLASELTPLDPGQRIAALAMIGDTAPHHRDDIFVALAPPVNQIQARPALTTGTVTYTAGNDQLTGIHALTLDATGQLWVAESGAIPARISVWSTDTPKGRLVREFFSPPDPASPIAVDPLDPNLIFAGGCEWRIDPATGRAAFLRVADSPRALIPPKYKLLTPPDAPWSLVTPDNFNLGPIADPTGLHSLNPILSQTPDGKFFITARRSRIWTAELTGLQTLHPLASGRITLP